MTANFEELGTAGGELFLPPNADGIVPDIDLYEVDEVPTALAYVLKTDPAKVEWEHQFSCNDARMYAGSVAGSGVVVITGSFDVSPLTGFTDQCPEQDEE